MGQRDRVGGEWGVEYYESAAGEPVGSAWLDDLDEAHFAAWVAFVEMLLIPYGKNIPYRNWVKPLGDGLFELRIDQPEHSLRSIFDSAERAEAKPKIAILLRAFCTFTGRRVVIVFGGYDKGTDPSKKRQQRAIKRARKALDAWRREPRRS
jgi:putative component of toxin-antitoxin plasmid stabilization module